MRYGLLRNGTMKPYLTIRYDIRRETILGIGRDDVLCLLLYITGGKIMKYYSVTRPIMPGSYPQTAQVVEVKNFDEPTMCPELGQKVWGVIEFEKALSTEEASAYELIADEKKQFWAVTTSIDDNGNVASAITDMVWAVVRPENSFLSTKRKDIYVDYFESREEADQHVKDAQDA